MKKYVCLAAQGWAHAPSLIAKIELFQIPDIISAAVDARR